MPSRRGGAISVNPDPKRPKSESRPLWTSSLSLPAPKREGAVSVEKAIERRRSVRAYFRRSIDIGELSQLLWAAQGITDSASGLRSAPSAGALYPLEVYVFVRENGVEGLSAGIYHYQASAHRIERVRSGDHLGELMTATGDQEAIGISAVCIMISGVLSRTARKYGQRARQYVHQESGAAAENVCLQATAMGLGTVFVGAFTERSVGELVDLGSDEVPLILLPIGMPQD